MLEARAGNEQILKGTGDYIELTITEDGAAKDASTATVTITRLDGSVLVANGAAVETGAATGIFRYTLTPAQCSSLDVLAAEWSVTVDGLVRTFHTTHEIAGGVCVTLAELREQSGLEDSAKVTPSKLIAVRRWFEKRAERHCGVAFVPRASKDVVDGTGTSKLLLPRGYPRVVRSAKVDGVTVDTSAWELYNHGELQREDVFPFGRQNIEIIYEHGFGVTPTDLADAAAIAIRHRILGTKGQSKLPDNALAVTNEFGNVRLAQPGPNSPFGLPDVDRVVNSYRVIREGAAR